VRRTLLSAAVGVDFVVAVDSSKLLKVKGGGQSLP
jgi:hypothetical protein